jgi:ActR/RegA family two-component response regulator
VRLSSIGPPSNGAILGVDDDVLYLRCLSRTLELHGFALLQASDGNAAIDLARRYRPRLALVDLMLENEHGLDLIMPLRAACPETAIALISGQANAAMQLEGFLAGAPLLSKPVAWPEIERLLRCGPLLNYRPPCGSPVSLARLTRQHVEAMLSACGGNRSLAARNLKIDRHTLLRILKRPVGVDE